MDREIPEVGVRCVSGGARELHPRLHGGEYVVARMILEQTSPLTAIELRTALLVLVLVVVLFLEC